MYAETHKTAANIAIITSERVEIVFVFIFASIVGLNFYNRHYREV